jgi:hypothetical protein
VTTSSPNHDAPRVSASGHDLTPLSPAERDRLAAALTPEERRVIDPTDAEPELDRARASYSYYRISIHAVEHRSLVDASIQAP